MLNINSLPNEVLEQIIIKLPSESILNCATVCHRWYHITNTPSIRDNFRLIISNERIRGNPKLLEYVQNSNTIYTKVRMYTTALELSDVQYELITKLELIRCGVIDADFISRFVNLEELCIKHCQIDFTTAHQPRKNTGRLKKLTIMNLLNMNTAFIDFLNGISKDLTHFHICNDIEDDRVCRSLLIFIVCKANTLTSLIVEYYKDKIGFYDKVFALETLRNLRTLRLVRTKLSQNLLDCIRRQRDLEELDIFICDSDYVTCSFQNTINSLCHLKRLTVRKIVWPITHSYKFKQPFTQFTLRSFSTTDRLEHLPIELPSKALRNLVIHSARISKDVCHKIINGFQNLKTLNIGRCSPYILMSIFENLPNLQELRIELESVIIDDTLSTIFDRMSSTRLRILEINNNNDILTDDILKEKFKNIDLRSITLNGMNHTITDDGITGLIENCPNIEFLKIMDSRVTELALMKIAKDLIHLHTLELRFTKYYSFHVFTDAALKSITKYCKNLRKLTLPGLFKEVNIETFDAVTEMNRLQIL